MAHSIAAFRRFLGARAAHYTEAQLQKALDAAYGETHPAIARESQQVVIDLPDCRQPNRYSCGAASAMACGRYYGVGPSRISQWEKALGTTVERSTHPYAIRDYLRSLGLHVEDRHGMTLEDLAEYAGRGWPVITPIQDYGADREPGADFAYGHWLCVVGAGMGVVIVQDSALENAAHEPGGDVPKSQAEDSGNIAAPGKAVIWQDDFRKAWHDKDIDGNKFLQYGIAVGPPAGGACDFYSLGKPVGAQGVGHESGGTTPEAAGYVERDVRCQNCGRANETATKCLFYEELNQKDKKRFALDVVVTPYSCCNAQTPKRKQTVEKSRGNIHAPGQMGLWDEAKHPRGQPQNAGEFASGSGGGAQQAPPSQPNSGTPSAAPAQPKPEPEPETANPSVPNNSSSAWQERQEARDKSREQLDGADLEGHAMNAKVWKDFAGVDEAARQGKVKDVSETLKGITGEWAKHWDQAQATLQAAGADEADLAKMTKLKERAVLGVVGKAKAYVEQLQKYHAAKAAESDLGGEPQEPKTPDYPAEPNPEDYGNDEDYERDRDAVETETERMEAQYDKEYERWGKDHERWTAKSERAADKVEAETDRLDERREAVSDVMDQYRDTLAGHLSAMEERLRGRLDSEEETDPEPEEEPEESEESEEEEPTLWLKKSWESSKHPRGGDPKNPGRFSRGGGAGAIEQTKPYPPPDAAPYPSFPGAPGAKSPPANAATRNTGELRRPTPADYMGEEAEDSSHPSSASKQSPLHQSLERARMTRADNLSSGINQSLLLTLEDGTQGVFKPEKGEKHAPRTAWRREIAASRVAELLGFEDLVPTTTVRRQRGEGVGSMQVYVPGALEAASKDVLEPFDGHTDAARAAVFDYLMGNVDRHFGNWLVKDGQIVLIDNGAALPESKQPRYVPQPLFWVRAVQADLRLPDLSHWKNKWSAVEDALRDCGIEDKAMLLCQRRFQALLDNKSGRFADLPWMGFESEGSVGKRIKKMYPQQKS